LVLGVGMLWMWRGGVIQEEATHRRSGSVAASEHETTIVVRP
jgi:hypothetical protein